MSRKVASSKACRAKSKEMVSREVEKKVKQITREIERDKKLLSRYSLANGGTLLKEMSS